MASRSCTVEIYNATKFQFTNPRMYLISGFCNTQLESDINPGENDSTLFVKAPYSVKGSVGVLTYDLFDTREKMAIMFSVPFNFNFYSNWFAVGIFSSEQECDYNLYYEMYYLKETCFVRGKAKDGKRTYDNRNVVIDAWMTDTYTPTLTVEVRYIADAPHTQSTHCVYRVHQLPGRALNNLTPKKSS